MTTSAAMPPANAQRGRPNAEGRRPNAERRGGRLARNPGRSRVQTALSNSVEGSGTGASSTARSTCSRRLKLSRHESHSRR